MTKATILLLLLCMAGAIITIRLALSSKQITLGAIGQSEQIPQPENFDVADYPPLEQASGTQAIDIVDTNAYGDKWTSSFILPEQKLFGMTFYSEDKPSVIVFFNMKGEQIDVFSNTNRDTTFERRNNQLLGYAGYHTVTTAGVGDLESYIMIANDELVSRERIETLAEQSTQVHVIAHYFAPKDSVEARGRLNTVLFKMGDVWKKVLISADIWIGDKYDFKGRDVTGESIPASSEPVSNPQFNVVRTWFDKQEFFSGKGPGLGSPTGTGSPASWNGIGYYTATVEGQKFRFSSKGKQFPNFDNHTQASYFWLPGMRFVQVILGSSSYSFPYTLKSKAR